MWDLKYSVGCKTGTLHEKVWGLRRRRKKNNGRLQSVMALYKVGLSIQVGQQGEGMVLISFLVAELRTEGLNLKLLLLSREERNPTTQHKLQFS